MYDVRGSEQPDIVVGEQVGGGVVHLLFVIDIVPYGLPGLATQVTVAEPVDPAVPVTEPVLSSLTVLDSPTGKLRDMIAIQEVEPTVHLGLASMHFWAGPSHELVLFVHLSLHLYEHEPLVPLTHLPERVVPSLVVIRRQLEMSVLKHLLTPQLLRTVPNDPLEQ